MRVDVKVRTNPARPFGHDSQPRIGAARADAAIVSKSPAFRVALARVSCVALTNSTVLLLGETGVGKDVVAVRPVTQPNVPVDTTETSSSCDPSGKSEVLHQFRATVMVETMDGSQNLVVYKTVLLDGLKAGDAVEIGYTRERAVDLQRAR